MVNVALFVRLRAGREAEVENFLRGALPLVNKESSTIAWFGIRMGPSTFGIFDAFPDDSGPAGSPFGPGRGGTDEKKCVSS